MYIWDKCRNGKWGIMSELARELGITREAVRQIKNRMDKEMNTNESDKV